MARLRRRVDDDGWPDFADEGQDSGSIADVELVMNEPSQLAGEPLLIPPRITLWPEENGPLVVIDAMNAVPELAREIRANFRANEAGGAGDEDAFVLQWSGALRVGCK